MCFSDNVISQTFMLGDSVKVSPVLSNLKNGDQYSSYFPDGRWVSIYDPSQIIDSKGGKSVSLTADSASVNIHQKSGTVLPFLYNNQNLRTTRDIETNIATAIRIVRDPMNK
jgi:alpha-glucosidase (family GH31 glycosyl hydrolase)